MKKLFYLFLVSIVFINAQCKPEPVIQPIVDAGTLRVRFLPTYEGVPLYMDKALVLNGSLPIKFQRLAFFTSWITGTTVSATQKVDFSSVYDEKAALEGITISIEKAAGTYDKSQLGIGIDRTTNKKVPSDYKNGDILAEVADYWDSWNSYIFTKTEGKFDKDGSGKFANAFSYHTGTDEMYRVFTLPNSVVITAGKVTDINVEIDFKKVLNGANGLINPLKDQNAHSLANKPVGLRIMDNYTTALSVK